MVVTFECTSNRTALTGEFADMRAASAALPDGAYTTFRTYGSCRVLRLEQHAQRLRESVALMGGAADLSDNSVRRSLSDVLRQTGFAESRFRLTLAKPVGGSPARFFMSIEPFTPYPETLYLTGVACISVALRRDTPHAKSTAFIAAAGDAYGALPPGIHEGLMVGQDGAVLEGLSSSFFAVLDATLHTEQARALVGVTQSLVLELAGEVLPELPVSATAILAADLPRVDECFITSVSREVLPVVRVDDQAIGDGKPGPVARRLLAAYRSLVEREAAAI